MEQVKTRAEIQDKYKWNLADIFSSQEKWEEAFDEIKEAIPLLTAFKGTLKDKKSLKEFFLLEHKISLLSEKIYVYAKMSRDEDNGNDFNVSMCDRAYSLLMMLETETAFVTPELSELDDNILISLANDDDFKDNNRYLLGIVRNKKHLLSEKEEKILAQTGEMANSFDTIFTMLDDVDMRFDDVLMPNGEKVELSHGRYGLLLQDKCRETRKQAYESMYNAHINNINTLCALYSSSVKKDVFYARVRNYESVLEGELFSGNIPQSVYTTLIEQVHKFLPVMHSYVQLRQELLGITDGKMYDMYVPLIDMPDVKYTFEQAQELSKKALAPLGEDYVQLLDRSFKENWIDVYETKGKTSGAYSWGAYGVHPYMLLNYQDRLDDVFTLVHEAGHSMHTYYSDKNLPYEKAQYKIFVAEVASTVNEVLLLKYMLSETKDKKMKAYLLNHFLDQFRTTLFRQTMFAEFEWETHKKAENGEPLTVSVLNKLYGDLNRAYYGNAVETDKFIETEWSRIPHFYRAYYVYQYATGFSSAVAIADMILNEGAPAVERYKKFLSSGGSDFPNELLKITGVDLTKPGTVNSALKVFESTLKEFERMVKK